MGMMVKGNSRVKVTNKPVALHVSKSGGHRIVNSNGYCYYIKPEAWDNIEWKIKEGFPHFVK